MARLPTVYLLSQAWQQMYPGCAKEHWKMHVWHWHSCEAKGWRHKLIHFWIFEIWPDPESTEYWTYTQSKLSRTIGVGVGGRPAEHGIYIYMYIYIFNKFRVAIYQLSPPFIGEQKIPKHVRDWRSSTGWFYFWLQGLELNRLICHRFPGWGVNPKYMMCIYVYMYIYTTEVYHFAP